MYKMIVLPEQAEKVKDLCAALVVARDPDYKDLNELVALIKKFIIDHSLIIYGGAALDYALRLKGSHIYPDDIVLAPDFDCYSYDSITHAYELAQILYKAGYSETRAISALHLGTMRVDIANNHFVADLSYCPRQVFDKLPTLEYNGMRFIHPDYQRLDTHHSLSFPYEYAPREVIFARWAKDIRRFSQAAAYYDIKPPKTEYRPKSCIYSAELHAPFHGFGAYALIYSEFLEEVRRGKVSIPSTIIKAEFTAAKVSEGPDMTTKAYRLAYTAAADLCEFIHFNPADCAKKMGLVDARQYEPYFNLLPAYIEGKLGSHVVRIYSSRNNLLTVGAAQIDNYPVKIRHSSIQYTMHYFLAKYFIEQPSPLANVYLAHYCSLLAMAETVGALSIVTFGAANISSSQEISLSYVHRDLRGTPTIAMPLNYHPARHRDATLPTVDLTKYSFYNELGREVISQTV